MFASSIKEVSENQWTFIFLKWSEKEVILK